MSTYTQQKTRPGAGEVVPLHPAPRKITAFTVDPSDHGFRIGRAGPISIKPHRGLPDYISGTIEKKYQSIPVIDVKARKTHTASRITEKSCVVLFRDEKYDNVYRSAALYGDVMEVIDMIRNKKL